MKFTNRKERITMMKEKTILIVVCVSDEELLKQWAKQIQNVFVPPDYYVHILPIYNAKSMTSAYNQAASFPAKYKIYLHQDTFLINQHIFLELIALFTENEKLGLIGVAGCQYVPSNGVWWEGKNLVGQVVEYRNERYQLLSFESPFYKKKPFTSVQAIDGLFMATQYDLPWREDLFQGFHFYDVSQSFEFRKAGYLVGVADQTKPWCLHYNGDEFDAAAYETDRQIFVEKYINIPLEASD
jgi:Glycosyltransferase like family